MSNGPILLLCLFGFGLMGALPLVFFRRGRLNARWLATAAPFLLDAALLASALAGLVAPVPVRGGIGGILGYAAVLVVACAIALTGSAAGANRIPLALWHQDDDAPIALVTHGPYARMRHPFYTSFMLLLLGAALAMPHALTIALFLAGWGQLYVTALREERRLLATSFGGEYARYMSRTGRFLPRLTPASTS